MIRRPPRSTLFSLHDALPISPVVEIIASCSGRIASFEIPCRMIAVEELPLTSSGRDPKDQAELAGASGDRKSTRLNSSHSQISYAVFCLKKKNDQPR